MSNIKISGMPIINTPSFTDVFPVVQNGVTYRESMDQLKTLMFSEVVSPSGIVYVSKNGSDVNGDGTMFNPYQTINFAMNSITTASDSNPITIYVSSGLYTEASVALKPWVSLLGDGIVSTVLDIASFTLHSSWEGGNNLNSGIFDVNLKGAINFTNLIQPTSSSIVFYTSILDSICTFNASPLIAIKECPVNSSVSFINTVSILINDLIVGDYSSLNDSSTSSDYFNFLISCTFIGNIFLTSSGLNSLTSQIFTSTLIVQPTLDGTNNNVIFDSISYKVPIIIGGTPTIQILQVLNPITGGTGTSDNADLGKILVGNGSTYDVAAINSVNPISSSYSSLFKTLTIEFDGSTTSNVLPTKYLTGLNISYDSLSTVLEDVGACKDSTDVYNIFTPSSNLIDITVNGLNGLDTGTVQPNTKYFVFSIGDSTGVNQGRGLFSLSSTTPTLPINFDIFRLIGYIFTDGSSNIINPSVPIAYNGTLPTVIVSGTSYDLIANTRYIADNAALCTLTLPTILAVGDWIEVLTGNNFGGWKIAQNVLQVQHFGASSTTVGVGGFLQSSGTSYDVVKILCIQANTDLEVISSVGTINVT